MDCIGLLKIIRDSHGNERIPNFVAFTDSDEILIGQEAKDQVLDNLPNTIFDLKRLIGRKFTDPTVQSSIKFWPFKVVAGNHDKAMIVVRHKGFEKLFSPEEILSLILMRLKDIAEESGLKTVTNVVITVPTFFNDSQRQATKDAAKLAGLNVLRLINESSAVLNRELFYRCEKAVEECLYVSKITACYVQEVILAGAGSQLIKPLLEEIFNGDSRISEGIDPYTAVVQGAAIEAAILSGFGAVGKFDEFSPSRLAIDDPDITLVPRNTKIPGKFSTCFTSSINRESGCSIGISEIENEGTDSRDYHRLGKFNLHTVPPSSAVVPLELGCSVDINRIFSIAHVKDKILKHKVTWGSNTERFTAEEMDDMLRTAEEIRTAGNQVKRGKQVKRLLEMFVHEFFPEHGSSVLCKNLDPGALRKIQEVAGWLLARSKQVL
ncbi:heat shock cognate 70 kDa protein-like [Papaver somniferum]|uniref:heat shock cognate 70 kDa protein-like n=1 Tax=Papaver somniferum TaxID=3469 RepID=UPI000E704F52|nr:heat shock cognate 70 kDa protein-like [Papaver somniferum]